MKSTLDILLEFTQQVQKTLEKILQMRKLDQIKTAELVLQSVKEYLKA